MLQSLLKIGEWQSQGKTEWDRFLAAPKVNTEDKKGNKIANYVLPILFDLDEMEVVVDKGQLREFNNDFIQEYKLLKTLSARNKKIYSTVEAKKIKNIYNTFFGENIEDNSIEEGHLLQSVRKDYPHLLSKNFDSLLKTIPKLKPEFLQYVSEVNNKTNTIEFSLSPLLKKLELTNFEELVAIYIAIKSTDNNIDTPTPFAKLDDYQKFLKAKFKIDSNPNQNEVKEHSETKLCYASGKTTNGVRPLDLGTRFSLNKMFVTETKNYASLFSNKNYSLNYQVSESNQEKLDYASSYLLTNLSRKIADIDHVIIPQFQDSDNIDLELALSGIIKKSDLLFNSKSLKNFTDNIEDETNNIFWLNFIAFDSDRKGYFKSTEIIKDVSKFHFQKVLNAFTDVNWEFKEESFVDWNGVMTEYGKSRPFNFNSVYGLIPIRKDKENKNKALDLFKAVLENRKVRKPQLHDYFCELMLCHYYERYNNVPPSSKDYFSKSVRDSVFKYLAFFQVLKKLNLIDMEDSKNKTQEIASNKYDKEINDFFNNMNYSQEQQAMFFLGRMLNKVEFIQKDKKKTVIDKVNFNGMDCDKILRLRNSLIEKAKQYGKIGSVVFDDGKFGEIFNYNKWTEKPPLSPQESLFFILTGYSFRFSKEDSESLQQKEIDNK